MAKRSRVTHKWKGGAVFAQIEANARTSVKKSAFILEAEIVKMLGLRRSPPPSTPGQPPGTDSGALRRSVTVDFSEIRKLKAKVGPNMPYARIQEFGGTISAGRGALAVPVGKRGREIAKAMQGQSLRARNLDYIPPRGGRPPKLAEPDSGTIVFVLLKSVTLPPRPYVRPALKNVRRRILRQFTSSVLLKGLRLS